MSKIFFSFKKVFFCFFDIYILTLLLILLLIGLFITDSFVLADFAGPQTEISDTWKFKSASSPLPPESPPQPPTPPTPPTPPDLPPQPPTSTLPTLGEGEVRPQTEISDTWKFKSASSPLPPESPPQPPTPPTPPTPPDLPPQPPTSQLPVIQEGTVAPQTEISDTWKFLTTYLPVCMNLNIDIENYCLIDGQGKIDFSWVYKDEDGDYQTGWDLLINHVNEINTSTAEVYKHVTVYNSSPATNTTAVYVKLSPGTNEIAYNTTYYWWVKTYNEKGESDWATANSPFTTPAHAYPYPDFFASSTNPKIGEDVMFMQDSMTTGALCYNGGVEHLCQSDVAANYEWDFNYDKGGPYSSFSGNATTSYSTAGLYKVMLKITDTSISSTSSCKCFKSLNVGSATFSLPKWKEVSP